MLCKDSVRNKNPKVTVSGTSPVCVCACACVCVFVCVCVCVCVYIHAHVRFVKTVREIGTQSGASPVLCVCAHRCVHSFTCTLCRDSVINKNPKSLQAVQAQFVCVCVQGST